MAAHTSNNNNNHNNESSSSLLLATCAIRSAHINGPGDFLADLVNVPVCFGELIFPFGTPAEEIMAHVENVAMAHLLAATKLEQERPEGKLTNIVGENDCTCGRVYNVADLSNNIIHQYHDMAGLPPAFITLPYWLLWILVKKLL